MKSKIIRNVSLFVCILLILTGAINSATGQEGVEAYVGSISNDEINQGDTLTFTMSLIFIGNGSLIVYAMNATFLELLGESSIREARRFDFSIDYGTLGFRMEQFQVFTDNFDSEINLNPGKYNVSIGFATFNGTQQDSARWNYQYGIVNQTIQVFGTSQSTNIARGIGYLVLGISGALLLYYFYNRFK